MNTLGGLRHCGRWWSALAGGAVLSA